VSQPCRTRQIARPRSHHYTLVNTSVHARCCCPGAGSRFSPHLGAPWVLRIGHAGDRTALWLASVGRRVEDALLAGQGCHRGCISSVAARGAARTSSNSRSLCTADGRSVGQASRCAAAKLVAAETRWRKASSGALELCNRGLKAWQAVRFANSTGSHHSANLPFASVSLRICHRGEVAWTRQAFEAAGCEHTGEALQFADIGGIA